MKITQRLAEDAKVNDERLMQVAVIRPLPVGKKGFQLEFTSRDDEDTDSYELCSQRRDLRIFKTIETAAKTAYEIGFYEVRVLLFDDMFEAAP